MCWVVKHMGSVDNEVESRYVNHYSERYASVTEGHVIRGQCYCVVIEPAKSIENTLGFGRQRFCGYYLLLRAKPHARIHVVEMSEGVSD